MIGYIYIIENLENHKKYIGQTINIKKRIYEHFRRLEKNNHVNQYLQNAYNKYGKDSFEYSYREFEINDLKELDLLEKYYIEKYNSYNNGYNLTLGGKKGEMPSKFTLSDENFSIIYHGGRKWKGLPATKISEYFSCSVSFVNSIIRGEGNSLQTEYAENLSEKEINEKILTFEKIFNLKEGDVYISIKRDILTIEEGIICLCLLENIPDCHHILAERFNCEIRVFTRLKKGETHRDIFNKFNELSKEERRRIARQYQKEWNVFGGRSCPLLKEDLFLAFSAKENGKSSKNISDYFNVKYSTMRSILNHTSRKKEYIEYLSLPKEEKEYYKSLIWP